jgi:DNA topoisomerase-3
VGVGADDCDGEADISPLPPAYNQSPICVYFTFLSPCQAKLGERQTCPPDYLTESELITLMERHGIGTDASIPVHINNICERNYVALQPGRKLKPTNLGIVLVHGYKKVMPLIALLQ